MSTERPDVHVLLVRHAQIDANVEKRWHGWTDSPLNATGRLQIARVAERLAREHTDIKAIYASPLQRTRDTAQAIAAALGMQVIPEPDLREYGIGELEGVAFHHLEKHHGFFTRIKQDAHFAPPGGESVHQVSERIMGAFARFRADHAGEKILAVSHGAVMGLGLAKLLHGDPFEWDRYFFANTSVSQLRLGQSPALIGYNCTAHLDPSLMLP
jgi:broad specificity phosphatase PhoE